MGGGISFTANADSVASPGEKSVLSDPIESGVTAEQLFEGIEKYVREGKTATGKETKFEVTDKGDSVLVFAQFEIPAMFGGGTITNYNSYTFNKEKLELKATFYNTARHLEAKDAQMTTTVKIHNDPIRVESWADHYECRSSGPFLAIMMGKMLKSLGTAAEAKVDSPSPGDPEKFSVVAGPIEDVTEVTPDSFVAFYKKYVIGNGATENPDGSVTEERGFWGLITKTYAKLEFSEAESRVTGSEYGEDGSLLDQTGTTHIVAHRSPFRIEQYNVTKPGRRSGEAEKKNVEDLVNGVVKTLG